MDMGRQLRIFDGELFFGIKTILLILNSSGNFSSPRNTELKVLVIKLIKNLAVDLSNKLGILSGPLAVLIPRLSIIFCTSVAVIGDIKVLEASLLNSMGVEGVCWPRKSSIDISEDRLIL